jgi:hypothetical protein
MSSGKTRFNAAIAIGIIGVVLTSITFFAAVSSPDKVQTIGFLSVIFSEVLTTAGVAFIETKRNHLSGLFFRAGIYPLLFIYLVVSVLIAIFFIVMDGSVKWLLASEAICLGLLAAVTIVLTTSSSSASSQDFVDLAHSERLRQIEKRIDVLHSHFPSESWSKQLAKIREELKYSDHSLSVPIDDVITEKLSDIESLLLSEQRDYRAAIPDDLASAAVRLLGELSVLASQRSREAANIKRGGF